MDEVFEQVGDPVLVLHPDDANTVSLLIPPGHNERPTVWSRQFKLRKFPLRNAAGLMTALGFPELNLDCRLHVHMYSKGDTGPANNWMNVFAQHCGAPKCGTCYMQFEVNDNIVDAATFLHVFAMHSDVQFTNKHYNDDIGTFLAKFQDMVEKNALKQAAEDALP